jgi:hypothetical protein
MPVGSGLVNFFTRYAILLAVPRAGDTIRVVCWYAQG